MNGSAVRGWVRRCLGAGVLAWWAFASVTSRAADPAEPLIARLCALVPRDEVRSTLGVASLGELSASGTTSDVHCRYASPNNCGIRFYIHAGAESYALRRKAAQSMNVKDLSGVGDKAFVVSVATVPPSFSIWAMKGDNQVMVSTTKVTEDKTIALMKKVLAKL